MKIELKNLKYFASLSEETNAFTANLYINGKVCGVAKNSGHGGETYVLVSNRELYNQFLEHLKTLPKIKIGKNYYNVDTDLYIGDLVCKILEQKRLKKFNDKIKKSCLNSICYAKKGEEDTTFYKITLSNGYTIEQAKKFPKTLASLHNKKNELERKGFIVFNTNI